MAMATSSDGSSDGTAAARHAEELLRADRALYGPIRRRLRWKRCGVMSHLEHGCMRIAKVYKCDDCGVRYCRRCLPIHG